ncbi:hypothetical protein CC78DRAFT_575055 [Lojkania enalia]|uniref:Uncharacterized protein n=1 Tax=Lojkania enalia TaxID=147567 RepID=A0A9P4NAF7_9PLEO|nr:hypothetical protein CC78DRAFT_575055 [Didymosphaeria enalia]
MPRPNRYHPYNRSAMPATLPFPRLPTLPKPYARPMPTIAELPTSSPYQQIYPGYIKAFTTDGKDLVARSIMLGPDGTFHLQMEIVRCPSPIRFSEPPVDPYLGNNLTVASTWDERGVNEGNQVENRQQQKDIGMVKDCMPCEKQNLNSECAILDSDDESIIGEGDGLSEMFQESKAVLDMIRGMRSELDGGTRQS